MDHTSMSSSLGPIYATYCSSTDLLPSCCDREPAYCASSTIALQPLSHTSKDYFPGSHPQLSVWRLGVRI